MSSYQKSKSGDFPIFMFGFERSGTTLLSMVVGSHPNIAVPLSVTGLWYRYASILDSYNQLLEFQDAKHLVQDLLGEERIKLWDADLHDRDILRNLDGWQYPKVVEQFHRSYARDKRKPRWGNIDIATIDNMDLANQWFPDARFLHIVRDCRDVALSHESYKYGASNALECAQNWDFLVSLNRKMGSMIDVDRYMVVRYEDLVLHSEPTLKRICDFIGEAYSDEMLSYPKMVETKIPKDKRSLWPALNKPLQQSKAFGWKTEMRGYKRSVIEDVTGQLLHDLGYETYETIPRSLAYYVFELWCFLGRGHRLKRLCENIRIDRRSNR